LDQIVPVKRLAFSSHPEPQNFEVNLLCIFPTFRNNCFDFFSSFVIKKLDPKLKVLGSNLLGNVDMTATLEWEI